jgi:protein PET100
MVMLVFRVDKMGNWKLEIGKMAIYMAFPVTSFYIYHQVDWFEEELVAINRKLRNKDTIENAKQIEECVSMMRAHQDKKFKEELAKMKKEMGLEEKKTTDSTTI